MINNFLTCLAVFLKNQLQHEKNNFLLFIANCK